MRARCKDLPARPTCSSATAPLPHLPPCALPPVCSLVAQQPLRRHIVRSASVLPRALADVLKAPRPTFSFLTVECESAAAARQLQAALAQLVARVPPLATYVGHCAILTLPGLR